MNDTHRLANDIHRLAPDTKWLLQVAASVISAVIIGITTYTQYQLSSIREERLRDIALVRKTIAETAEHTYQRAINASYDRNAITDAFKTRDARHEALLVQITELRDARSRHGQRLDDIATQLKQIVDAASQAKAELSTIDNHMGSLLAQMRENAQTAERFIGNVEETDRELEERIARLEGFVYTNGNVPYPTR